jgi:hypothetical protein
VVPVEDLVGEERARTGMGSGETEIAFQLLERERHPPGGEGLEKGHEVGGARRFVERDSDRSVGKSPQVDLPIAGPGDRALPRRPVRSYPEGVEERLAAGVEAQAAQAPREQDGQAMDAPGDGPQPLGPVVDRVHAGHHREQDLRGADVARGLVAPDVLLARLQREAIGRPALGVVGHSDQPARDRALVLVLRGEVRGVGPAVAQGNPEALGRAHRDVGPELAGGAQQGQGEDVGRHHEKGARLVDLLGEGGVVPDAAVGGGVLDEHAEEVLLGGIHVLDRAHVDADPEGGRAGPDHRDRLGVAVLGHEEAGPAPLRQRPAHGHGLGGGGGLVEQ